MLQLQQDKDFAHWCVDFGAVKNKAQELGIHLIRHPVPPSLENDMQHVYGLTISCKNSLIVCVHTDSYHMHTLSLLLFLANQARSRRLAACYDDAYTVCNGTLLWIMLVIIRVYLFAWSGTS